MPWWQQLDLHEQKIFSQNGEDGVLQSIFENIGTTDRFCVEFGVQNGTECNSRYLLENKGWTGLWLDSAEQAPETDSEQEPRPTAIRQEMIHAENINDVFAKHGVPSEFDLLSIDIDGNDYWVWGSLRNRPRVVVIEYNSGILPTESRTIRYDQNFCWGHTDYFGASLLALVRLGKRKGYTLIYCESTGNNAFFVETSLVDDSQIPPIEQLYRPPGYGKPGRGHPHDEREWIEVEMPPAPPRPERIGCC